MAQPTAAFNAWLKDSMHMKLSSDASVLHHTKEGITNIESLTDFDKKNLECLPAVTKESINAIVANVPNNVAAKDEVPGTSLSSISVHRLIVVMNAAEHYTFISKNMSIVTMHYNNVLKSFRIEWETYQDLRDQDSPEVPLISGKDNDCKVIMWVPVFLNYLTFSYDINGPLSYIFRDDPAVPAEVFVCKF